MLLYLNENGDRKKKASFFLIICCEETLKKKKHGEGLSWVGDERAFGCVWGVAPTVKITRAHATSRYDCSVMQRCHIKQSDNSSRDPVGC